MHSRMTIGKRFIITSGVLMGLTTLLTVVAIVLCNRVSTNIHSLATDSVPGLKDSGTIQRDMLALRGDYLLHIGSINPEAVAQAESKIASDSSHLAEDMKQYEGTITQEDDRQNFEKLRSDVTAIQELWTNKILALSRADKNAEAIAVYLAEVAPHMDAAQAELNTIVDRNKSAADTTTAATTASLVSFVWTLSLTGLTTIVAGVLISWYMIHALNRELQATISNLSTGAEQITAAASQVSSSSQSLAQGSSQQAAALEETSSSAEEINSMARKNSDNAGVMSQTVLQSRGEFEETNHRLTEMVTAMDEINASSAKISKIIKVIDEIAFQTNILALNAAVEAARAGEAGMGFAVVADEVRNLAQRCAQAAKDTTELIEDSIGKSESGKTRVEVVAASVKKITKEFSSIVTLVEEVGAGSREQASGIELIRRALSQMEQLTQSSAASAEEGAAASQQLHAQAQSLKDVVVALNARSGGIAAAA